MRKCASPRPARQYTRQPTPAHSRPWAARSAAHGLCFAAPAPLVILPFLYGCSPLFLFIKSSCNRSVEQLMYEERIRSDAAAVLPLQVMSRDDSLPFLYGCRYSFSACLSACLLIKINFFLRPSIVQKNVYFCKNILNTSIN